MLEKLGDVILSPNEESLMPRFCPILCLVFHYRFCTMCFQILVFKMKTTTRNLRAYWESWKESRIHFASFSPLDLVKHRHKDNSSFEFFKLTLYALFFISSRIPIVVDLGKILHSNSVFLPPIPFKSLKKLFFPYHSIFFSSFVCDTWIVHFTLTKN